MKCFLSVKFFHFLNRSLRIISKYTFPYVLQAYHLLGHYLVPTTDTKKEEFIKDMEKIGIRKTEATKIYTAINEWAKVYVL